MPVRKCTATPHSEWSDPKRGEAIELKLKTITPMFGGGYEARNVDPVCVIRPAAIRGHLRFWWRATVGAQYATAGELFSAEEALWGSAARDGDDRSGPGKVVIAVQVTSPGTPTPFDKIDPGSHPKFGPREGVFLFPFQAQKGDDPQPAARAYKDVQFQVDIRFPSECRFDVECAAKAWTTFGGVGARTRRGCGAVEVLNDKTRWLLPANREEQSKWLTSLVGGKQITRPHHTVLQGARIILGTSAKSANAKWSQLGEYWSAVRKGHIGGEEEYTPMNGAHWDDYRRTLVVFARSREEQIALAKPYMGLPIIYQKFERGKKPATYAPRLEADASGRMGSPVILKPVALSDGNFAPLVAVLRAPEPQRIKVVDGSQERIVRLEVPSNDPVLRRLREKHPLDAVVSAAETWFDGKTLTLEVLP